jgi:hypothetical protein
VERYLGHYNQLLGQKNYDETGGDFRFDNLIKVMLTGLPSTDWVPPLLRYFDRFKYDGLLQFALKLDNKFSSDWIAGYSPTERIDRMNEIIKTIEADGASAGSVIASDCFKIDSESFIRTADSAVYGRRFTRYLLLKLDYIFQDPAQRISLESLSVEHVLPQNPSADSQWKKDFTDDERNELTDRLGNLVLITGRKNTSLGNADFEEKKTRYFAKNITTCPNSLRIIQKSKWTPAELKQNHETVLNKIREHYGVIDHRS